MSDLSQTLILYVIQVPLIYFGFNRLFLGRFDIGLAQILIFGQLWPHFWDPIFVNQIILFPIGYCLRSQTLLLQKLDFTGLSLNW